MCLIWRLILLSRPPDRQRSVSFPAVHLSLRYRVPAEVELPVEAPVRHVRSCHVLKCIVADHVNDGANHCPPAANTQKFIPQPLVHTFGWLLPIAKNSKYLNKEPCSESPIVPSPCALAERIWTSFQFWRNFNPQNWSVKLKKSFGWELKCLQNQKQVQIP